MACIKQHIPILFIFYMTTRKTITTNLTASVSSRFFCSHCNKKYWYVDSHRCDQICPACFGVSTCDTTTPLLHCSNCLREFYGQQCFEAHQKPGSVREKSPKTVCQTMRMCSHCFCVMNTGRSKHVCGYIYCAQCRSSHM